MTKNEFAAKLGNDVNVEALLAEIEKAEDDNAVLEILKRYNVELTAEDVRGLEEEEELDETALEGVSGGCKGVHGFVSRGAATSSRYSSTKNPLLGRISRYPSAASIW